MGEGSHEFSALEMAPDVRAAFNRLLDENALLRAALAELRERLDDSEQAADSDPLTGLPNARQFGSALERVVGNTNRHGTPAAMLAIDVRGLPDINARHGQTAGDAALIHVARVLQTLIRTSDFAGRLDETRFGLLLDHLDADSAIDTAERIERCIGDQPLDLGAARVPLKVAIGVASILRGDRCEEVAERARANAERAKAP